MIVTSEVKEEKNKNARGRASYHVESHNFQMITKSEGLKWLLEQGEKKERKKKSTLL